MLMVVPQLADMELGKLTHTELSTHTPVLHNASKLEHCVVNVGEVQQAAQPCSFVVTALHGPGLYASPAHVNTNGTAQLLLVLTCMAASPRNLHHVARRRPPERATVTPATGYTTCPDPRHGDEEGVGVTVGVPVGVFVRVGVLLGVGVFVAVLLGVGVFVAVLLGVGVLLGVRVLEGVCVGVPVLLGVPVWDGVLLGVPVLLGVLVCDGVWLGVAVRDGV